MKNIIGLVLILAVCALPVAAQNTWDWSMPGSSGVVGDGTASLGLYTFTGAYFAVQPGSIATVDARYPVTNTVGSATDISPAWTTLQMTVHDQYATTGSVTATLYEVDYCTSSETDQDAHCDACTFSGPLDFANNAYYIHVSVAKTDNDADPRLYALAIF